VALTVYTCKQNPVFLGLLKVLNYIIVLLELCVVDCKVIKVTGCVGIPQCGAGEWLQVYGYLWQIPGLAEKYSQIYFIYLRPNMRPS